MQVSQGEHLYGMCGCSAARALMTSPRALRLLLMACASFRHSPVLPDFFTLQHDSTNAQTTTVSNSIECEAMRTLKRVNNHCKTQQHLAVSTGDDHDQIPATSGCDGCCASSVLLMGAGQQNWDQHTGQSAYSLFYPTQSSHE
jgi:hypothetical protein